MKGILAFIACMGLSASLTAQSNGGGGLKAPTNPAEDVKRMAFTVTEDIWKDSMYMEAGRPVRWSYDHGVVLEGITLLWKNTGNNDYFRYIQKCMDHFVDKEGNVRFYKESEYNIDHIKNARILLTLYKVTGQEKYRLAIEKFRNQLRNHPRTKEGGYWHKQRYPWQMWLDGLYMGQPFYAEYSDLFHQPEAFNDITRQFVLMEVHSRDSKTGLLYHGYDESRQQRWADKTTGRSPNFWGRAMGWYGMGLVDALEYFPAKHPGRDSLIAILNRFAASVQKYQEPKSGLWYQVLDKGASKGNYFESSAACMFVYALTKGVRLGYLPEKYLAVAQKGYKGIQQQFLEPTAKGGLNLKGTVSVAGLGGEPYRDGSYEYYLSEKVITNDAKGVGAFLLAAGELSIAPSQKNGKGLTVLLDQYYNNEWKNGARTHYVWNEMSNGGYSLWGHIFHKQGVNTDTLSEAPTAAGLSKANIYIITDPDTEKETAQPHGVTSQDADAVYNWVKAGGVLVVMQNDSGNAEIKGFNRMTEKFGITFNENSIHRVQGSHYEQGALTVPAGNAVFPKAKTVYIKELATLQVQPPAKPVLKENNDVIIATAQVGKGAVFAVGDPWFYNEYLDGRKLPATYENYQAASDLVDWLIKEAKSK
jgi:unsaturated rhamnogalacturonyl hydrolase